MFDPDAAIAVARVLAKCSPEDWIFDQNFDRNPHTSQNVEELSKYWRLVKIYQTDLIRQYFESMYFLTKKNLPHTVKNPVKILMSIFCFYILTDFLIVYGPLLR